MKILALDSSGMVASAALWEDGCLIAEYTVNYKKTHSQTLLPMVDEIARMTELSLDTLDAIAVAAGPGSFTGLRIGSATAKGLGLALNRPLIPVPTVDALAYNLYDAEGLICPIMDARRQQVYTGIYRFPDHSLETIVPQAPRSVQELCRMLEDMNEKVIFLGDGVPVYKDRIDTLLTVPHSYAPGHVARQRAGAVAALGAVLYARGLTEDAAEHAPIYLRRSQAERNADKNGGQAEPAQTGHYVVTDGEGKNGSPSKPLEDEK